MRVRQKGGNTKGRRRRRERMKGNGKKEKEEKALLLSLSCLKSRISLTWKPNLSHPPPTPPHFSYSCIHLQHKLIDHCYRTKCASRGNTQTQMCLKSWETLRTRLSHMLTRHCHTSLKSTQKCQKWHQWTGRTFKFEIPVAPLALKQTGPHFLVTSTTSWRRPCVKTTYPPHYPPLKIKVSQGAQR